MVDKINLINNANSQKPRVLEKIDSEKTSKSETTISETKADNEQNINAISDKIKLSELKDSPPVDLEKVSAIKDAIARGDYPIDIERISDALMQAYKDIK